MQAMEAAKDPLSISALREAASRVEQLQEARRMGDWVIV